MIIDFVTNALNSGNAEIALAPMMQSPAVIGIVL